MQFIQSHGGFVSAMILVLTLVNLTLSFLSAIFNQLKTSQPGWLGKSASVVSKTLDLLSANVEHPKVEEQKKES
jgi:hypothetical protein